MNPQPVKIIPPDAGDAYWALTEKITFKITPEDTAGRFGFSTLCARPGGGPPPHRHRCEDEMFVVIDGDIGFVRDGRSFKRSSGFAAYLPKDSLHTYNNVGAKAAELLVLTTPCGFEQFIKEWSKPVVDPDEPVPEPTPADVDRLLAAARRHGIELHPESKATSDPSPPAVHPAYWVLGHLITLRLVSSDTGGTFTVAQIASPPGAAVLPHWHVAMDEVFYVAEGTYEFTLVDRVERLGRGTTVFVPRGALHGFRNVGNGGARLIDFHTPGGFEHFFIEAGVRATDRQESPPAADPVDPDKLLALLRKHGMDVPQAN